MADRTCGWTLRAGAAAGTALFLLTAPAVLAVAEPVPPTVPSQEQVDAARAAATGKAAEVSRITAALTAAQARADAAGMRLSQAVEDYNAARVELDRRTADAGAARRSADAARAGLEVARRDVGRIASRQYRQGPATGLEAWLDADGPDAVLERATLLGVLGTAQSEVLADVRDRRAVAAALQGQAGEALAAQQAAARVLEQARDAAEALDRRARQVADQVAAEQTALQAQLVTLQSASEQVARERREGLAAAERARAQAQARARAEALARARAEAARQQAEQDREDAERRAARERERQGSTRTSRDDDRGSTGSSGSSRGGSGSSSGGSSSGGSSSGSSSSGGSSSGGSSSGSSADGRAALAWATDRIGLPYRWGGAGPDSYDCSGLTMRAWQSAGVSLSHSSRAQYRETKHVSYAEMRPGDLIFYGTDPGDAGSIYHVAMYAGGGMMVEAPRTGLDVRLTSVRTSRMMPWAGRP